MYRIIDLQGDNGYSITEEKFKTKKDIIKRLIDFHYSDFCGCSKYKTLKGYIYHFKSEEKRLEAILDFGQWEIKKIKKGL